MSEHKEYAVRNRDGRICYDPHPSRKVARKMADDWNADEIESTDGPFVVVERTITEWKDVEQ